MSTIDQTENITTKYLIEPNPSYDFNHKTSDAYVVQNIAEDVNYTDITTTSSNPNQLIFQLDPANVFMDRGVQLRVDLPLIFERTIAPLDETVINENTYAEEFFQGYQSLSWKQFGFVNAIQSISVTMDGFTHPVTDVAEMLKIVSRYYDEDIVHQRVPASLPDVMDYNNYAQTSAYVTSGALDAGASKISIKPSIINSHNIFGNFGNPDYNTRTPMVSWFGYTADKKLRGTIHSETCFLPFSIFGIRGLDTQSLIGVKSMAIKIIMKSNWVKHLFCTKNLFMSSVKLDEGRLSTFKVNLGYRTFCPPQYIDEAHGLSQGTPDYNLKYQVCELQNTTQTIEFTANEKVKKVPTLSYKIKAIPKAIYLAATLKANTDEDVINTPDIFTRIDGVEIEVAGRKTMLPNYASGIMEIAKANGYQDSMEIGYYLGGYPLKLNMTDDLGAKSNALVGSRQNIQNEIRINNLVLTNVGRYGKACSYDVRLVCIYDGMLAYRNGKFILFESLLEAETGINVQAHVSALYNHQIQKMNMVGGSFGSLFASAIPTLKRIGQGVFNTIKKFATDRTFRGQVIDAFNGEKSSHPPPMIAAPAHTPNYVEARGGFSQALGGGPNVTGGYSSHQPIGGRSVGSIRY